MSMSEFFEKNIEFVIENVKKYGLWLFVFIFIWWSTKKIWYWLVMPLLFWIVCNQIMIIKDIEIQLSWYFFVACWLFILSLLKGLFVKKG
jgi:hypothetical protein